MADATKRVMMRERDTRERPQRIVSGAAYDEDLRLDASVRPKTLDE